MVKRTVLIMCTGLMLSGCMATQSPSGMTEVASVSEAKEMSIYDIELAGTKLTVPFEVSKMEEAGYTVYENTVDTVARGIDNIVYYVDSDDGMVVVNLGTMEEECPVEDAYVIDILADKGNTDTSVLKVYGNIGFSSTKEEVEEVFGEPIFEDNGLTMYSSLEEGAYMDGVYVAMDGDEVFRVEVLSTKDFIDWNMEELEEFESESVSE